MIFSKLLSGKVQNAMVPQDLDLNMKRGVQGLVSKKSKSFYSEALVLMDIFVKKENIRSIFFHYYKICFIKVKKYKN